MTGVFDRHIHRDRSVGRPVHDGADPDECCVLSWRYDIDDVLGVLAAPCYACALRKAARCSMAIADSGNPAET
jgi:hypothetical protein